MADTAVSMVPWPEIITTGRPGWSVLISSSRASPSRRDPWSQMSRKTRRGTRSAIAASALSLSCAVRVSCPSSSRIPATSSRMSSSSSTMRISDTISDLFRFVAGRPALGLFHPSLRRPRQDDTDHCSLAPMEFGWSVVQFQPAAMVFDDLLDDRETKPGALLTRCHIGLEKALAVLARQALAVVHDIDLDHSVPGA